MLSVSINDSAILARLDAMPAEVHAALLRKVTALDLQLEAKVKNKLSNDVLQVRTGNLRRSIFSSVDDSPTAVIGKVASSGDVKYAGIQEFGGTTPPHDILPSKAKALHFMAGGKEIFAKVVHHPGSHIPERSYLRSSLADMKDAIVEGMTEAVRSGVAR